MPSRSTVASPRAKAASVTVSIPAPLRKYCGGPAEIDVAATTVRVLLDDIERRFPELHRSACDETGAVRRHINIFVNSDHMRDRNGLDTALEPGDVVTIMTAVSGG